MSTYDVEICRVSYSTKMFTVVGAKNEKEARSIVLDRAGGYLFDKENYSNYEVVDTFELAKTDLSPGSQLGSEDVIIIN
tara:strand:+ start:203 stop:439 length:237 start_codon:yes stop_codon:yes gene_type:complete